MLAEENKKWKDAQEKREAEIKVARENREREIEEAHKKWKEEQEKREIEIELENKKWRDEQEKRQAEMKIENAKQYESTSKFVGFITDKITEFVNLDFQKKLLSYHGSFDALTLFREMDSNNDNTVSSEELTAYFADDEDFIGFDFLNLVKYWSGHSEDRLTFVDFQYGISAHPGPRMGGRAQHARHNDDDQKASQDKSWRS